MKTRVITAVICLAVLIPILYFSEYIPLVIVLALLSCAAVFEIACCFGIEPAGPFMIPYWAAGLALPFLVRYCPGAPVLKAVLGVFGLLVIYGLSYATLSRGRLPFSRAAAAILFTSYILAGVNCILVVRDSAAYSGRFMFMLILLGAWVTDAGAQLCGIAFGKRKLIEEVSPHKTVEGAIGGAVCGVAGYVIYALIVRGIYGVHIRWGALIILGVVIAAVDQLGDLIASYVKREYDVKDYGWLFPGHGGAVDRLDSIVSNSIVITAYIALGLPGIFLTP